MSSNGNLSDRVTAVEVRLESFEEERDEARRHRERLQDKLDMLVRLVFVGLGVLIALQFIAPILISVLKLGGR